MIGSQHERRRGRQGHSYMWKNNSMRCAMSQTCHQCATKRFQRGSGCQRCGKSSRQPNQMMYCELHMLMSQWSPTQKLVLLIGAGAAKAAEPSQLSKWQRANRVYVRSARVPWPSRLPASKGQASDAGTPGTHNEQLSVCSATKNNNQHV